jgi:hypothetical protein
MRIAIDPFMHRHLPLEELSYKVNLTQPSSGEYR